MGIILKEDLVKGVVEDRSVRWSYENEAGDRRLGDEYHMCVRSSRWM